MTHLYVLMTPHFCAETYVMYAQRMTHMKREINIRSTENIAVTRIDMVIIARCRLLMKSARDKKTSVLSDNHLIVISSYLYWLSIC